MRRQINYGICDLCGASDEHGDTDVFQMTLRFEDRHDGRSQVRSLEYGFNHADTMPKDQRRATTSELDDGELSGGGCTNSGVVGLDVCTNCLTGRPIFKVINYRPPPTTGQDTDS